jgi:CheY-like chemotaxis protein
VIAEPFQPDPPILLIDDNPQNLRLASFLLMSEGLQVRTAENAERALELLSAETFSLVLLDIQLPGMDGLELTRRIRNTAAWSGLPIVALTAYAMRHDKERMLAAGCDGYIAKPVDTRSFTKQVLQFLNLDAGVEAASGPEITRLRDEFLLRTRAEVRALLAIDDIDLGAPCTFAALHRWAGFAGSVGLGSVTDIALEAERLGRQASAGSGPRVRQALTSILALIESAR